MRIHALIVAGVLMLPVAAFAQDATPVAPSGAGAAPSLSPVVPLPRPEATVSGYRVLAISAGTVIGLVVANYLSGGMITPILAAGSESAPAIASAPAAAVGAVEMAPAAAATGVTEVVAAAPAAGAAMAAAPAAAATTVMAGASYGVMAARSAVLVAGAAIGGYVGNWIYGK